MQSERDPPAVTVILEGDNEHHSPGYRTEGDGPLCLGLQGLCEQDYPLDRVTLVLVGELVQLERWERQTRGFGLGRVCLVDASGTDYFQMKELGIAQTQDSVLAFLDSDVRPTPEWLRTLVGAIQEGFDVSAGLTQLHWHGWAGPYSPLMLAVGTISWGAIQGPRDANGSYRALGFHANNVGFRSTVFGIVADRPGKIPRACSAYGLFHAWRRAGCRSAFRPAQRVYHAFHPEWWWDMHRRAGLESLLIRRIISDWPHAWTQRLGVLEPLLTLAWRCLHDPSGWWRYTTAVGIAPWRRILYLPLLLAVSLVTRSVEAIGAYQGMLGGELNRAVAAARPAEP